MAKDIFKTFADWRKQEVMKIFEDRLNAKEETLKILDDAGEGYGNRGQAPC